MMNRNQFDIFLLVFNDHLYPDKMSNSQQPIGDIPGAFNPSSTLSNAISSNPSNSALRSATATPPPRVTSPAITAGGLLSPPIASRTPIQTSNLPKPGVSYPAQALNAFENYKKKDSAKVVVRFKATGNAPIMKNNYFRITAFNRFQAVIQFLRKELGWKQGDALVSKGRTYFGLKVCTDFLFIVSLHQFFFQSRAR
jgi:Ubiquitin-like autophagy protein Apg12